MPAEITLQIKEKTWATRSRRVALFIGTDAAIQG
jgi:hypothetical protein